NGPGRRTNDRAARTPVRGRGGLSRPQGQHEFPAAAGPAGEYGKRAPKRTALLQRHRSRPELFGPELPGCARRRPARLPRGALLRGRGSIDPDRPESLVREARCLMFRRIWAAPALLFFLAPATAHADERILHYLSDVQIQKDSSLEVTETIDVRAEHDQINHGIFRDFPTRYKGPHGSQMRVGFTFEGATLDGASVPASIESVANGVRIKIGEPDK